VASDQAVDAAVPVLIFFAHPFKLCSYFQTKYLFLKNQSPSIVALCKGFVLTPETFSLHPRDATPTVGAIFLHMAANPILPLYYNDIDRSTRDWSDEEFGCYMRLLMHQWAQGEIPKETHRLSRIVTSLGSSWELVRLKFIETETGMINEKLEEIRAERMAYLKKQQENGKKGGRKPKENPTVNPLPNPKQSLHNEDEDEKENEDRNLNSGKGVQGEGDPLNEMEIGQAQQYVYITAQRNYTAKQILTYWDAYLIHSQGTTHGGRNRQLQHFRNWLKLQPNEKSGRNHSRLREDPSIPGTYREPL
jgi:uncharacterized protein YdaU (DUF1376 family)